jgi:hypothetical protein
VDELKELFEIVRKLVEEHGGEEATARARRVLREMPYRRDALKLACETQQCNARVPTCLGLPLRASLVG